MEHDGYAKSSVPGLVARAWLKQVRLLPRPWCAVKVEIQGLEGMREVTAAPLVDVRSISGDGFVRLIDGDGLSCVTLTGDDLRYLRAELLRQGCWS